jgi:thiol-disulfide isomerase/thioredoxin
MNPGRIGMMLVGAVALLAVAMTMRATTGGEVPVAVEHVDLSATLKDKDGKDVALSSYAGRPILVNLWATWCGPCRIEMPQLIALYETYKDRDLMILGISIDDTPEKIRVFADEFKVPYPLLVGKDHPALLEALGYTGPVPISVFVRRDGTVAARVIGIDTTASMQRRVLALLEKPNS